MQPSSLVFLVIIAVWAAYFVQYWIRRREHLATARSVDQFSESMRVLERRVPLPATDLSTPTPRSYAVSPARPARAQVLVKRAETPASAAAEPARSQPVTQDRAAARRTRAMVMLGALSTVVVTVPLVALSMLPALTLLVPLVAVSVAVAWARATAQAERRARLEQRPAPRSSRPVRSQQPMPAHARNARPQHVERHAQAEAAPLHGGAGADMEASAPREVDERGDSEADLVARGEAELVARGEAELVARGEAELITCREPELFDVQAQEARGTRVSQAPADVAFVSSADAADPAPTRPVAPLVDEDDIPLTWDPVPVPRPTYAMKSRVTRPAPTAADLVGDADTEYAAYGEAEQLRRVAGA